MSVTELINYADVNLALAADGLRTGVRVMASTNDDKRFESGYLEVLFNNQKSNSLGARSSTFVHDLTTNVRKYEDASLTLANFNEMYNANTYINESLDVQQRQLDHLSEQARSQVLRTRQRQMTTMYDVQQQRYSKNVVLANILVTSVCALLLCSAVKQDPPVMSLAAAAITCACVIALYLCVLLVFSFHNRYRRRTDWSKFYFSAMDKVSGGGTCSSA